MHRTLEEVKKLTTLGALNEAQTEAYDSRILLIKKLEAKQDTCKTRITVCAENLRKWEMHDEQMRAQRSSYWELKLTLLVGWILIIRDFVNTYDAHGKKVADLVLVMFHRPYPGAELVKHVFYHFLDEASVPKEYRKCDSLFFIAILDHHLQTNPLFESGCIVVILGDHGP